MEINKENWSAFAVDYFDGTLSQEQERTLFAFLDQYPNLKEEFDNYNPIAIEPEQIAYPDTQKLKKTVIIPTKNINEANYQSIFVLYIDKELTPALKSETEDFLKQNPSLQNDFKTWELAQLAPDLSTGYPHKEALKKKHRSTPLWLLRTGAAAALISGIALLWNTLFHVPEPSQTTHKLNVTPLPQHSIPVVAKPQTALLTAVSVQHTMPIAAKKPATTLPTDHKHHNTTINGLPKATVCSNLSTLQNTTPQLLLYRDALFIPTDEALIIQDESKRQNPLIKTLTKPLVTIGKMIALRKRKQKHNKPDIPPALRVLDGGIAAFNTLTGADVIMAKVYNAQGQLTQYTILGNNWQVNRKLGSKH